MKRTIHETKQQTTEQKKKKKNYAKQHNRYAVESGMRLYEMYRYIIVSYSIDSSFNQQTITIHSRDFWSLSELLKFSQCRWCWPLVVAIAAVSVVRLACISCVVEAII